MVARHGLRILAGSILFLSCFVSLDLRAQTAYLSGRVLSVETGERIPGASLSVLGTGRGVKSNRDGEYRIGLERDQRATLRVTAPGYRPDTLHVQLRADSSRDIRLQTLSIEGGTITVTADRSRSEGRRIMRRVIDTKDAWQSAIVNYQFRVYSRISVRTGLDSTSKVLAILESAADGFWAREKGYAERIVARKQTANLPVAVNQVALFDLQNFYNDRLEVGEYDVISPVAHDAFDRYDFDLVGTGVLNGSPVYNISVEPLSGLFPAFGGTLWIDQSDYTIAYLDLSPNDAIKLGPLRDIHIVQTFAFLQGKYWLPNGLAFRANVKFDFPIAPTFRVDQDAVLQDYIVNGHIPDSVFAKQHSVASAADSVGEAQWNAMRTIPLASDEERAYEHIDSVIKLPPPKVSLSPTALLFSLLTQPDLYQFNRVEGSRLQFSTGLKDIAGWPLSIDGTVGYSFGQAQWKYSVGLRQALSWRDATRVNATFSSNGDIDVGASTNDRQVTASIGGTYFHETLRRGKAYSRLVNTLTALVLHEDYPNYYDATGFSLDVQYLAGKARSLEQIYFRHEQARSDTITSNYSLLLRQRQYRPNPAISDGTWDYAGFQFNGVIPTEGVDISAGIGGESGWTAKLLSHSRYYMRGSAELAIRRKLGGWGDLTLKGSGHGLIAGETPPQNKLFLETHDGPIRSSDAFHTLRPFEFEFNDDYELHAEHDFYDLPTRLLGIRLPFTLHWIGFADFARLHDVTYDAPSVGFAYNGWSPQVTKVGEVGFALGGILNVLRVDAAWRLTQDRPFVVTGSLEFSF